MAGAGKRGGIAEETKVLTVGPHHHVASSLVKPLTETHRWLNMNCFERVGWLRMSGFRVALLNPNAVDSLMAKNGLYLCFNSQ